MDISATFLPVAVGLIDDVFPTPVLYRQLVGSSYDPSTGTVTKEWKELTINAGVLNMGRTEDPADPSREARTLTLWLHHGPTGLPELPTTADRVSYQGVEWKVTGVAPTYASTALIASKVMCEEQS